MMRRTRRGSDRDIEAQLRDERPEPRPELTRAIADRVRPRRRGLMGGLARVPLTPVAGLTAIVLAVALALGGGTAALNTAGDALNVRKAKTKVAEAPSIQQYEEGDVVICVYNFAEHTVSPEIAAQLVEEGVAEYGPCPDSILNQRSALNTRRSTLRLRSR